MQAPANQANPVHQPPARSLSRIVLFVILATFSAIGLLSVILIAFSAGALFNRQPLARFTGGPATIDHVRALKLLTVLTFDVTVDLEAQYAERRGVWLGRGSADFVVDFSRADVVSSDEKARIVTLRLPRPVVRSPRLDPERTKLLTMEKTGLGWWTLGAIGSDDEFQAESRRKLEDRVRQAAREAPLVDSARGSATQLLTGLYAPLGWTVRVQWADGEEPAPAPPQPVPVNTTE